MTAHTKQPRVSVVIPVYNTAPYLGECLDSLLEQTESSWECLAVDDGSTDGSAEILADYAARDPRIRALHRTNGGPSAARNAALDIATGEWVAMLDSDDTWHETMLEKALHCAESFGVDMVQVGIQTCKNGMPGEILLPLGKSGLSVQAVNKNYLRRTTSYGCDKVIRHSLLEHYSIRYDTTLRYSEDLPVVVQYCAAAERVGLIGEPLYKYRVHETSSTVMLREGRHPASHYLDMLGSVVESAKVLSSGRFPTSRVSALYPALLSWLEGRVQETRSCLPPDAHLDLDTHIRALQWELFRLAPWKSRLRAFRAALRKL